MKGQNVRTVKLRWFIGTMILCFLLGTTGYAFAEEEAISITDLKQGLIEFEDKVGTVYTIKEYIDYYNFIYDLQLLKEDTVISIVQLNELNNEVESVVDEFTAKTQPE